MLMRLDYIGRNETNVLYYYEICVEISCRTRWGYAVPFPGEIPALLLYLLYSCKKIIYTDDV